MASMKRVLVVDDSKTVLTSVKAMLMEDYEVLTAASSKEAQNVLDSTHIDLMLLDIEMPGGDGINFLKKLKKVEKYTFPIVFLSSNSDTVNVTQTALLGASGFIDKPFDKEKLTSKVDAWLTKPNK